MEMVVHLVLALQREAIQMALSLTLDQQQDHATMGWSSNSTGSFPEDVMVEAAKMLETGE